MDQPPPGSGLTRREREALTAVGVTPAVAVSSERASTATAARNLTIAVHALDVPQTAERLGCTEAQVEHRLEQRTLLGIRQGTSWRIPAFQFDDDGGELPGWDRVAPEFPADVVPAAVERFLDQPSVDLVLAGEPAAPREWLQRGLDPALIAQAVVDAYTPP